MRVPYYILPFLGAVALAQELQQDSCQCPQVKCPSTDEQALCNCLNNREYLCKERCPKYVPTILFCPGTALPTVTAVPPFDPSNPPLVTITPLPPSSLPPWQPVPPPKPTGITSLPGEPVPLPRPSATFKPVICECPLVNCLQVWPGSCHCANTAAQNCYDRCGGAPPKLASCPPMDIAAREAVPQPEPEASAECECESIMCIQSWPESCYCANAAAETCFKKCGGKKPALQQCPPMSSKSLLTLAAIKSVPTAAPLPPNPHKVCGGGRANYKQCDEGFVCIKDPYTPGCGPACDGPGICVKDKMCGGFAGFQCEDKAQVCMDDPRDSCDPKSGGADCGGLCVTPHRSLGADA